MVGLSSAITSTQNTPLSLHVSTRFSAPMIKRKHRQRLTKMRRDGYLKRDNPMTPHINALLRVALDISVAVLEPWAEAWITMDATGSGNDRELPLHENARPSDACAIFTLLGREDDDKAGNSTAKILANWIRMGLSAKGIDVATASDASTAQVSRVRTAWADDIRAVLADAACLGLTGQEIYDAVTIPGYFPEHITNRLVALRESREDALVPTADEEILNAWRSFRENASRQGLAPDHFDVDPPDWFVKRIS